MKQGEKGRKIIFLNSFADSLILKEHVFALFSGGKPKYGQTLTCANQHGRKGVKCPLCELDGKIEGLRTTWVRLFTVIDTKPFTNSRTNETWEYSRVVLAANRDGAERLALKEEFINDQHNGTRTLKNASFSVFRSNADKSPRIGSEFQYLKHVGLKRFDEEDRVPFPDKLFMPDMEDLERAAALLSASVTKPEEPDYDDDYEDDEVDYG